MFSLDGYRAVLANGGVVRRVDRGVLAVSGADRAAWLQGLLTNDVGSMQEGERRYAAYLTPQGRMISDMNVIERGGRMLLDVPHPLAPALRERLDALIFSEDVTVTDESGSLAVWTVIRQDSFEEVIGDTLPTEYGGLTAIEFDTFEVIRIERGVPRFLADMDEETIPLEAGIEDRAISFSKGCYVGQEVIVRVTHRGGGRVAKRLVGWVAAEDAEIVPLPGARFMAFDRDIGRVTSAAFSPSVNRVVGLGYAHRDFTASGSELTVIWNESRVKATVR